MLMAQSGLGNQASFEVLPKTNSAAFIEGQESKIVADTAAGSSMMMFDDSKM